MDESMALSRLVQKAFAISGQSVPLGFDVEKVTPAVTQLPGGLDTRLRSLFTSVWPSDSFHVGRIELFGPDRINQEHTDLLPGCLVVNHGFLGIGSDGAGTIFCYCTADGRVYLIPHEYVSEQAVYARPWTKLEANAENIKVISEESWDSLSSAGRVEALAFRRRLQRVFLRAGSTPHVRAVSFVPPADYAPRTGRLSRRRVRRVRLPFRCFSRPPAGVFSRPGVGTGLESVTRSHRLQAVECSLAALFEWAFAELLVIESESATEG